MGVGGNQWVDRRGRIIIENRRQEVAVRRDDPVLNIKTTDC